MEDKLVKKGQNNNKVLDYKIMSKTRRKTLEDGSSEAEQTEVQRLKREIQFPPSRLQELVYNDQKYSGTVIGYVGHAFRNIEKEKIAQAVIYLSEAEKILQFGASCGRIINRRLIVCVLHNEACCFQKESQWAKALKYIEAIIFNYKVHLRSLENSPSPSVIAESHILKYSILSAQISFARNLQLAQYYLQFCSLNSQLKFRKEALESAKCATELYKNFFSDFRKEWKHYEEFDDCSEEEKKRIVKVISQMRIMNDNVSVNKLEEYLQIGKQISRKWSALVKNQPATSIDQLLSQYSIGHLVEIEAYEFEEVENSNNYMEGKSIILQIVHWAMGYFQIATQYRIISEERYCMDNYLKMSSDQFKLSCIYHLLSITLIGLYVPFNLLFMNQIISSYEHYYKLNLLMDIDNNSINFGLMFHQNPTSTHRSNSNSKEKKPSHENKKLILTMKKKKILGDGIKTPIGILSKRKLSMGKIKGQTKQQGGIVKKQYFETKQDKISKKRRVSSSNSGKSSASQKQCKNPEKIIKSPKKSDLIKGLAEQKLFTQKNLLKTFRNKRILSSSGKIQYSSATASHRLSRMDKVEEMDQYGTSNHLNEKLKKKQGRESYRSSRANSYTEFSQVVPRRKITTQGFIIPKQKSFHEKKRPSHKLSNKKSHPKSQKSSSDKKSETKSKGQKKKKQKGCHSATYYT